MSSFWGKREEQTKTEAMNCRGRTNLNQESSAVPIDDESFSQSQESRAMCELADLWNASESE